MKDELIELLVYQREAVEQDRYITRPQLCYKQWVPYGTDFGMVEAFFHKSKLTLPADDFDYFKVGMNRLLPLFFLREAVYRDLPEDRRKNFPVEMTELLIDVVPPNAFVGSNKLSDLVTEVLYRFLLKLAFSEPIGLDGPGLENKALYPVTHLSLDLSKKEALQLLERFMRERLAGNVAAGLMSRVVILKMLNRNLLWFSTAAVSLFSTDLNVLFRQLFLIATLGPSCVDEFSALFSLLIRAADIRLNDVSLVYNVFADALASAISESGEKCSHIH